MFESRNLARPGVAAAGAHAENEASFVNGEDIVIDGGLIWGRRFSEVVASRQALKGLFE